MLQQPELLAPAGSLETLKYAVMYGADAVYCALPEFGMRAAPVNLTVGELREGCIFAHARGKKVYLTLNTLPTNEELSKLPQYIQDAAEAGVDAFMCWRWQKNTPRRWSAMSRPRRALRTMRRLRYAMSWVPSALSLRGSCRLPRLPRYATTARLIWNWRPLSTAQCA